jgi:hypothetical protein
LREARELNNCIAIYNVLGSMGGLSFRESRKPFSTDPILPAISPSPVLARLAKSPFKDAFITFSANPPMIVLDLEGSVSLSENSDENVTD